MNNLLKEEPQIITDYFMRYDDETRELKAIRKTLEVLCQIVGSGVVALMVVIIVLCIFAM